MSEAVVSQRLVDALAQVAANEAGAPAPLVSVSIEFISGNGGAPLIDVIVERKTRTLLFLSANATAADGQRLAAATSVHRIAP
jgi:hypothetical protein